MQPAGESVPGKRKKATGNQHGDDDELSPTSCEPAMDDGPDPDPDSPDNAASDAAASDANRLTDQPAGESVPGKRKRKRKKATGHKKKAGKTEGGYTDKGRLAFKAEGNTLVTGSARTCIPDALCVLLDIAMATTPLCPDAVRSAIMGDDLYSDARFTAAQTFVQDSCGMLLTRVTQRFEMKGGLAYNLLNVRGLFLVHLSVSYGPHDDDPDDHCVAYDGLTVRDNNRYKKVRQLDDGDRATKEDARKVFNSLYPNMSVRIKNVFELR